MSLRSGNQTLCEIEMLLLDAFSPVEMERRWLAKDCLRRAAMNYEQAAALREAAACWDEAGEIDKALELYLRLDDYEQSATLLLAAGRHGEAQAQFERWLGALKPEDAVGRVTALLGNSLCLMVINDAQAARENYRAAREIIEGDKTARDGFANGRCWEALGQYGLSIERDDLVQVGYEKALAHYGTEHNGERARAARVYLAAVKGNRLLFEELTERLAEWGQAEPSGGEVEPGRRVAFVARGHAGNVSDVDYLMHVLETEPGLATTKLVDYALGLVRTPHGEERIKYYLFEGTQTQRNFAALYFKRLSPRRGILLAEAYNQGKIDRIQAFSG